MRKIYSLLLALVLFSAANINAQNVTVSGAVTGNGTYATLGAAFTGIGTAQAGANIIIDIVNNTNEAATTATLGAGTWATLTIRPSGGSARTITGSVAGNPMIDLNGADNVTINGINTGGNSLTISNTSTSSSGGTTTIRFITDATNNTITNCSVLGSSTVAIATNGGNILFAAGAVSSGNDNNTISNCNIGPAGSNLPTKGIHCGGSSNTDPGTANSGLVFSGNNIFDYFSATVPSAGIYITSGTVGTSISNNKFYQSATRTQTTGSQHSAVWITNTNGNNYSVTGNTIGYASAGGTGTYGFAAVSSSSLLMPVYISVGTTTASNINGNTIAGIAMSGAGSGTGSNAAFRCIYIASGLTICNNNTIGSQSATGSITFTSTSASGADVMGIYNFGSNAWTTTGNTVGGITVTNTNATPATVSLYGIRCNTGSSVTWTCTNNTIGGTVANSLQSTSTSTGTTIQGIRNDNPIGTFTGNIIRNLTTLSGTGTTISASIIGLCSNSSANQTIGQNTIFNLNNTNATAASVVTGIQFAGSSANIIERNFIYNLNVATINSSAEINGIRTAGGTSTFRNNMIAIGANVSNAIGAAAINAGTVGINGILDAGGTNNFYHNSVYIGGTATAGVGASYAFNGNITGNTRAYRNNIFFNARTNSGATGKHYAVKLNGTAANPAGLTINNNVYYTSGTGGVFGFFASADVTTLAAWKTAVGQDANSASDNPQFLDAVNATPDLHINPSIATPVEAAGFAIGITDDFDGQTRSGLTPTDIGADAGNFTSLPNCTGTPAAATIVGVPALCSGTGTTLSLNTTYTDLGIIYQWRSSTTSGGPYTTTLGTGATQATGNLTATTYYICEITCTFSSITYTTAEKALLVNAIPTASASSNTPVCTGSSLNLTGTSDIGTTFSWTGPNSFASVDQSPIIPNVTAANAGTYSFTATANGCSSVLSTTVVATVATPVAPTTTSYAVCLNGSIPNGQGLTSTAIGAGLINDSQTINFDVAGQPVETNAVPGNIVSSATMAALPAGATVTSFTITYNNLTALSSSWRSDIRLGLSGAIVNAAASGTGATNTAGVLNYTRNVNTGITVTNTGGTVNLLYWDSFSDNAGAEATFPTGTAVASVTLNYSYPAPAAVKWYNQPTGGTLIGSGTPFDPIGVDPAVPNTNTSGTHTYYAEVSNGACPSVRTAAILTIGASLTATATASPNTPVCAGTSVTLNATPGGGSPVYTYSWKVAAAEVSTAASFSVTPASTTTYDLTITDGCSQTATSSVTVTVNPLPAAVIASGAGTFCTGTTITAANGGDGTIYFQGTTTGGTSTAIASTSQTVSASGTYYFRAQSAAGCWGTEGSVSVTIQTPSGITGTSASICAGASGSLQASAANCNGFVNSGTTINGTFTATTDPVALRPTTSILNTSTCSFDATVTRNYVATQFQVSISGNYVFEMVNNGAYDGIGYIVSGAFTPGSCANGTFVRGDDDDGVTANEPRLGATGVGNGAMTLTTGVTYTLISTTYSGTSGTISGAFSWTVTPPSGGQVMLAASGVIDWYTTATGGSAIGSGSPFNPVGVAGSGLANTNTTGTTTYYAACSLSPGCRTAVNFVINPNYTITASAGANGSVSPAGVTTLSCDGTGDQVYTITPDAGYLINDVVVDAASQGAIITYTFTDVTVNHTISATFVLEPCTNNTFTGTGLWSDGARWSCGAPPASGDNVTIASGANATLDVDFTVGGTLALTSTSTLTVNPAITLTISGSANFGGQSVTLLSSNSGTASLGQVTGTLTGATNVTVERYIPNNGFRSWRLLSVPVATTQSIRQAWQEGDANPLPKQNNLPGRGTHITGVFASQALAAAAGFDSVTAQPGMQYWAGAAWGNITSTTQPINNYPAYFLFIRGNRGGNIAGSTSSSAATTLRTTGTVFTGDQVTNIGASAFAVVANVYPSAINFTGLERTGGVSNLFYIWDSKKLNGTSLGMYQTFSSTNSFNALIAGGSYVQGQPNTTIESGQAFFVKSTTAGSITLKETAKVSSSGSLGFRPSPSAISSKLDTRLYNSAEEMLDANTVVFDAVYSKAVAAEDAPKLGNPGWNFAIETESKLLAVEGTVPVKENEVIQYRMWNMQAGTYRLEVQATNLHVPAGTTAVLEDSYLQTATELNATGSTDVHFTVDQNPASSSANRFRVVFAKGKAAAESKQGYTIAPNPVESGVMNVVFANKAAGRYSVRILGSNGQSAAVRTIVHTGGTANQAISLPATMGSGTYTVEIIAPDKSRTTTIVLVSRK